MDQLPDTAEALGMRLGRRVDGWDIVVDEYTAAAAEARDGVGDAVGAAPFARTQAERAHLREETLLAELIYRTLRACENTLRFLLARREWEREGGDEALQEMRRMAHDGAPQRRRRCAIYAQAPWLDLAERTDGEFSPCAR